MAKEVVGASSASSASSSSGRVTPRKDKALINEKSQDVEAQVLSKQNKSRNSDDDEEEVDEKVSNEKENKKL